MFSWRDVPKIDGSDFPTENPKRPILGGNAARRLRLES
jgi:hypothetical protein